MPRRKSDADRFLDELLAFLREMPWWVGPPCIIIAWALFAFIVPGVFGLFGGESAEPFAQSLFGTLAVMSTTASPFIAGFVAVIWLMALIQKAANARRLDRQTGIDSIRDLSWQEFEQLLAEAFRRQGYSVRDTGAGADGGIDLILNKDGCRTLVQAKQWKAWKVGVKTVRELYGVQAAHEADDAILVTSGQVTAEARRFAEDNGIHLIEGARLEQMIAGVQRESPRLVDPTAGKASTPVDRLAAPADSAPQCPKCGASMVRRVAKRGKRAGESFWGCSAYPVCRTTVDGERVRPA